MKQSCRFCRCTWEHGCPVGCYWVEPDLCSVCEPFLKQLYAYATAVRSVSKASLALMLDEVSMALTGTVAEGTPPEAAPGISDRELKIATTTFFWAFEALVGTHEETGVPPARIKALILGADGWELRLKDKLETQGGF